MILCRTYKKQYHRKVMLRSFNLNGKKLQDFTSDSKDKTIIKYTYNTKVLKVLLFVKFRIR